MLKSVTWLDVLAKRMRDIGFVVWRFVCLSSFEIILLRKRVRHLLYFNCIVALCVLCLFPMVQLAGLYSVIVAFIFVAVFTTYVYKRTANTYIPACVLKQSNNQDQWYLLMGLYESFTRCTQICMIPVSLVGCVDNTQSYSVVKLNHTYFCRPGSNTNS